MNSVGNVHTGSNLAAVSREVEFEATWGKFMNMVAHRRFKILTRTIRNAANMMQEWLLETWQKW
jgi:hypothetical protein